ncbi:MAG: phosphotransferase [Anaerolineae bacterium]|nr:phosphotransferase [Anaerolineae bacterium]
MTKPMVSRGPASRAELSPRLFDALRDQYGLRNSEDATDLGGSSNLNLLISHNLQRYVVRVYRPWVTVARLSDIQQVRKHLAYGGVPCAQPLLTQSGASWIVIDERLVEVEPYVEHDANMDTWPRLEAGIPLLGRIHKLLRTVRVSEDGCNAPAANAVDPHDVLTMTLRGIECIRLWDASPVEIALATEAETLAQLVNQAQSRIEELPRQLVHGDYWDNNVFFQEGRIVQVADFDFMGERTRVEDLALTLYYTNSTFSDDPVSDKRIQMLRTLVDAYDTGTDERLTEAERAMLPIALARTSLAFIAMIADIDSEVGARSMAAKMVGDVAWSLIIMRDLERWQTGFANPQ